MHSASSLAGVTEVSAYDRDAERFLQISARLSLF
jgi:hypothetical protein